MQHNILKDYSIKKKFDNLIDLEIKHKRHNKMKNIMNLNSIIKCYLRIKFRIVFYFLIIMFYQIIIFLIKNIHQKKYLQIKH